MKAKYTCTISFEMELDPDSYELLVEDKRNLTAEKMIELDLASFREDYDVFFEWASVAETETYSFSGMEIKDLK